MEASDAQPVALSATLDAQTAADHAVVNGDVSSYREARRAERAGAPLTTPADSSPAAPDDQAASTDASPSPASEAGKPAKRNAETRIQELLRERHDRDARISALEREIAASRQPAAQTTPAAPSPAPQRPAEQIPEYDEWLTEPGNEGRSYTAYQADVIRRVYAQERAAEADREKTSREARDAAERIDQYRARAETFKATKPDYWDVIQPVVSAQLKPEIASALEEALQQSEAGPQVLYHLGSHPEEFARLAGLPPRLAVYELGKLEASLAAPAAVSPNPLTKAPTPPTTLGRKSVDPSDQIEAAVASNDVSRYRALRLQQRMSTQR